jgi:integrase
VRGHFKKRGEKWYFWAELEPGADGRRRQVSKGGFRTRKEAEKGFAEFRDQVRRGEYVAPSKLTVGFFLEEEWLPAIKASIRPGTHDHYSRMVGGYVVPRIGARRLSELTPSQLNSFYAGLLVDGRQQKSASKPAGLSPKTVRHVHTLLHKAFNDAVRWGSLQRNPADRAEPPRPRTPEMKVWDVTRLRIFLNQVADDRLGPIWLLIATTGMRRGEVVGLRWSDVDLDAGRISIVQTHVLVNRQVMVSEPKTLKGRRSIAVDASTVTALRQFRRLQLEERLRYGELWTDTGLVVTHEDGTAINPRLFSSWFAQHARAAGLPPIRLHDLRHSYATAALAAGIPAKVVSERLGHANIAITLDTYSHVLPNMQEKAAEQVAQLILGS